MNVLVVNASVSDNEEDLGGVSAKEIRGAGTVGALTDTVGGHEGINGKTFFTGKVLGVTPANDPGFEVCTAKNVTTFGAASGIWPEGPTTGGSYHTAGLAHQSKTNHSRDVPAVVPGGLPPHDKNSLKV